MEQMNFILLSAFSCFKKNVQLYECFLSIFPFSFRCGAEWTLILDIVSMVSARALFYYIPPPAHSHSHCFIQQRHCAVCGIFLNIYPYKICCFAELCILNLYNWNNVENLYFVIQFKIWVAICGSSLFLFCGRNLISHFTYPLF